MTIVLPDSLTEGEVTRILIAVARERDRIERTNAAVTKPSNDIKALHDAVKAVEAATGPDALFYANERLYEAVSTYLGL